MATARERKAAEMAKLEARLEKVRQARQKKAGQMNAMVAKEEKRRVWKVGEAAMAAMAWSRPVRDAVAKELAKAGSLRRLNDPEVFADLLSARYVPTVAEIEERRERDAAANADGASESALGLAAE